MRNSIYHDPQLCDLRWDSHCVDRVVRADIEKNPLMDPVLPLIA
jgi:hypothetical protein